MTARKSNKAAEELAARMKRVAGAASTDVSKSVPQDASSAPALPAAAGPARVATPRTAPVRSTVDLQPLEHRGLRGKQVQIAELIGATSVHGSEVFRALLAELEADEGLAGGLLDRVAQRVRTIKQERRA